MFPRAKPIIGFGNWNLIVSQDFFKNHAWPNLQNILHNNNKQKKQIKENKGKKKSSFAAAEEQEKSQSYLLADLGKLLFTKSAYYFLDNMEN